MDSESHLTASGFAPRPPPLRFPPPFSRFDRSPQPSCDIPGAEETDDLAFDASAADVKTALEALTNVGTVDVTREDGEGGDTYAWQVTFTEPVLSAHSSVYTGDDGGGDIDSAVALSFPLLYAGGEEYGGGLGLGTLGAGGELNVTRVRRGTLGPLSGEVRIKPQPYLWRQTAWEFGHLFSGTENCERAKPVGVNSWLLLYQRCRGLHLCVENFPGREVLALTGPCQLAVFHLEARRYIEAQFVVRGDRMVLTYPPGNWLLVRRLQ